jgi:membrane associated rhomboid family serine protease
MKPSPPPRRRIWTGGSNKGFFQDPVLVIIAINLIVFIAALTKKVYLVTNLGLSPSLFTEKPWTILTNMFVHVEFWHIFGNMVTLFFFGRVVYQLVGSKRFLLVYFVGGILGNIIYIWLGAPNSIAIGASGAIYAIAGALVMMMPNMRVAIWGVIPMPLWAVVLLFFALWSIPNFIPGIAWQAHLGGLAAGLIAGFFFRRRMRYVSYR